MKRMVVLLLLGGILLFLNILPGRANNSSQLSVDQITKPYRVGYDHDLVKLAFTTAHPFDIQAPSDLPDYQKFQDYVYEKYLVDGLPNTHNWEIMFRQGLGTAVNLTNHASDDVYPNLNSNGTTVLFSSDRNGNFDIYSIHTDGSGLTRLTTNSADDYYARWSEDGNHITFISLRNGASEVFIMNANGSSQTRLTSMPPLGDYEPAISPDGAYIAFIRQMDNIGGSLWVMNTDGSNQHQITPYIMFISRPAWSPDGSLIGFDGDLDGDAWNELGAIEPDGDNLQVIFDYGSDRVDAWFGQWSITGRQVILTRVQWESYELYSYIGDMDIGTYNFDKNQVKDDPVDYQYTNNPDWYQLDPLLPVSTLQALPEYTRGNSVSLYWNVFDPGVSGFFQIKLQKRETSSSTWIDLTNDYTTLIDPPYDASYLDCTKYYFRARAEDHAENWEIWPADPGEIWSTFYQSYLFGRVMDNHRIPLPRADINVGAVAEPIQMNSDGTFHAYSCSSAMTLMANLSGYGSWPAEYSSIQDPHDVGEFYLPPSPNLVQNGYFSSTANWDQAGVLKPVTGTQSIWEGIVLGKMELRPDPSPVDVYSNFSNASVLRITSDGTRFAAWTKSVASGTNAVFFASQPPDGEWSSPLEISDRIQSPGVYNVQMAVSADGAVSVMWLGRTTTSGSQYRYFYSELSSTGIWSDPIEMSAIFTISSTDPYDSRVFIDSYDYVHAVWSTTNGLWYRLRLPDGSWQVAEQINTTPIARFSATLSNTDEFVLLHIEGNLPPAKRIQRIGGAAWSTPITLPTSISDLVPDGVQVKVDGGLAIVWDTNFYTQFVESTGEDDWSTPLSLDHLENTYSAKPVLLIDNLNRMHVVRDYHYWLRKSDGSWPFKAAPIWPKITNATINPTTQVMEGMHIYAAYVFELPEIVTSSLEQTVTIPADIVHPTLAFNLYQTSLSSTGDFTVSINDSPVYAGAVTDGWEVITVDLSAWSGETVDLKLETAYDPYLEWFDAAIDNVSIGAWVTPTITNVTPASISQGWSGTTVTIEGQNFFATPIVQLGDLALSSVLWIDENTLQITLPDDLSAGIYDLTVINPSGLVASKADALSLGRWQFLPFLQW